MEKEQILRELRHLGKQRGGYISLDALLAAPGLKQHNLLGKYWATWNEVVVESGLNTA
ncbi:MAG: hypothetical protein P0121_04185 [Nitrospira sp.]|nr:hypothetical protein [Nitrospira sp.]